MKRNLYTPDEITLCTYSAIYDANDFGGILKINFLKNRSIDSIKMKIQNIAEMLDEEGIKRFNYGEISPLTGLPNGQTGRRTNWELVKKLYPLNKNDFLKKCKTILIKSAGENEKS